MRTRKNKTGYENSDKYKKERDLLIQRYRDGELEKPKRCYSCPFFNITFDGTDIRTCDAGLDLETLLYVDKPDSCPLNEKDNYTHWIL